MPHLPSPVSRLLTVVFCASTGMALADPSQPAAQSETDEIAANLKRAGESGIEKGSEFLNSISEARRKWREAIGLNYAATYNAYVAGITMGDDTPTGASGELALQGIWSPGKRWTENPVELRFRVRDRQAFGDAAPSEIGSEMGALWGVADGFSDTGFQIPDFFLRHVFTRSGMELRYGQMTIDSQFDSYALRGAKQSFLNQAFASNPTIPFPGYGAGLTVAKNFDNGIGIVLGATNVQGTSIGQEVDLSFSSSDFFESAQVSYDFKACGDRASRLQLVLWHSDGVEASETPGGQGASLTWEQEIDSPELRAFARLATSDGGAAPVDLFISGGLGWQVRDKDLMGIAVGIGRGSDADQSVQSVIEGFYRWNVRHGIRITPDFQILAGEGYVGTPGLRFVIGLRAGIEF